VTIIEEKALQNATFQSGRSRAAFDVAVGNHPLRVDHPQQYQNRKKILQIATLATMWAMRAVFCDAY
jgi:hypothetical protein